MERVFEYHIKEGRWRTETQGWGNTHLSCGWGNGYIEIPESHWLHGLDYDTIESLNPPFYVHGGITYSASEGGKWVLGFDTAHLGDTLEKWPKNKVELHTKEWASAFSRWEDPREQNQNEINSYDHCEVCAKVQAECRCSI